MLSDRDIQAAIACGDITITPTPEPADYDACTLDVHLGASFSVFRPSVDPHHVLILPTDDPDEYMSRVLVCPGAGFVLRPGDFALASTTEIIALSHRVAGRLTGVSSLGRVGLQVHCTSDILKPGWSGTITLELKNINVIPLALTPGMVIGSLEFSRLSSPAQNPYAGRYMHQHGPVASRIACRILSTGGDES